MSCKKNYHAINTFKNKCKFLLPSKMCTDCWKRLCSGVYSVVVVHKKLHNKCICFSFMLIPYPETEINKALHTSLWHIIYITATGVNHKYILYISCQYIFNLHWFLTLSFTYFFHLLCWFEFLKSIYSFHHHNSYQNHIIIIIYVICLLYIIY